MKIKKRLTQILRFDFCVCGDVNCHNRKKNPKDK